MQESRDVATVELYVTVLLDQGADAPGSPQLGAKAIGHGTFQQQLDDLLTLPTRQCWWPTGREAYLQRFVPAALGGVLRSAQQNRSVAPPACSRLGTATIIALFTRHSIRKW